MCLVNTLIVTPGLRQENLEEIGRTARVLAIIQTSSYLTAQRYKTIWSKSDIAFTNIPGKAESIADLGVFFER